MSAKSIIWFGFFLGSTIGSVIPSLWGAGMFSFSGILFTAIGGILGIYGGFKLTRLG
ncbi:MAG: hypothetical protein KGI73_00365 [Patescibacteria group bacterium]|nr:hypothetical protein [Patescibacteria group bacterium]